MTAVVNGAEQLCRCEFTAGHIDRGVSGFRCSNQHNQVIFRSKLNGTVTTNASTLTNYIHQWTSSGISITVLGLILDVDSMCPVHISSFTDPECVSATDVSTTSIVGGVVAAVCVIAITVIVVVVAVVIKRRRTSYELRDLNRRYIRSCCASVVPTASSCCSCTLDS